MNEFVDRTWRNDAEAHRLLREILDRFGERDTPLMKRIAACVNEFEKIEKERPWRRRT